MPRHFEAYAPDWIDVNTQLTALGEDFGVICGFDVRVERDTVVVIARCYRPADIGDSAPVVQALAQRPIKSKPDIGVMCFSAAQDCWRQLDRGVLGARSEPVAHSWNGRPHIARRDKR